MSCLLAAALIFGLKGRTGAVIATYTRMATNAGRYFFDARIFAPLLPAALHVCQQSIRGTASFMNTRTPVIRSNCGRVRRQAEIISVGNK
jgi:hypothetical protein